MNMMDICGLIGSALMLWWSLAVMNFSMRYDRDRTKIALGITTVVASSIVVILNVVNLVEKIF